jgi:hypothetical protein
MMRTAARRSACATTKTRPLPDTPMVTERRSSSECSGSGKVVDSGSSSAVTASRKEIRCLRRLEAAFAESHRRSRAKYRRSRLPPTGLPNTEDKLRSSEVDQASSASSPCSTACGSRGGSARKPECAGSGAWIELEALECQPLCASGQHDMPLREVLDGLVASVR